MAEIKQKLFRLDEGTILELDQIRNQLQESTDNKTVVHIIHRFRKLEREKSDYYQNWQATERKLDTLRSKVLLMIRTEKEQQTLKEELEQNLLADKFR